MAGSQMVQFLTFARVNSKGWKGELPMVCYEIAARVGTQILLSSFGRQSCVVNSWYTTTNVGHHAPRVSGAACRRRLTLDENAGCSLDFAVAS